MTAAFDQLLGALSGIPDLDGAACIGLWEAFDPPEHGESATDVEYRHSAALHLCRTCPTLADCRQWLDRLPRSKKPHGVVAGRVITEPTTRKEAS